MDALRVMAFHCSLGRSHRKALEMLLLIAALLLLLLARLGTSLVGKDIGMPYDVTR